MSRILITGACGCLGRAVRRVGKGQHDFVLLDQAAEVQEQGGFRGSFTDADIVRRAVEGCDAIIHAAAMHGAFRGKASNAEFIKTNVLGAENLFQAALEAGAKRLAIASSMEVLIGVNWGAYGTAVLDETLPPRPDWIYPVTKHRSKCSDIFMRNIMDSRSYNCVTWLSMTRRCRSWGWRSWHVT